MENENKIYVLIEEYDFSELDESQQQLVLRTMTIEDYADLRKTVLSTSSYFDNEPILVAEDLVAPSIKKDGVLMKMILYKLPIYKVVAILIIVFCINKFIPEEATKEKRISEIGVEAVEYSETFNSYSVYSSNNSIKYNTGLSRVYN